MPYHQRRKSGHIYANASTTDVRRVVTASDPTRAKRPGLARRYTPSNATKLGKGQREREKNQLDLGDQERESFPQYCMTCEKQFVAADERLLYCSEACRSTDQNTPTSEVFTQSPLLQPYTFDNYACFQSEESGFKDIIPRATPSRPTSLYIDNSPPDSPRQSGHTHHSNAIASLRSLNLGPPSPPSPTEQSLTQWSLSKIGSLAHSPGALRPSAKILSATFDGSNGVRGKDDFSHPQQSRKSVRPRSIELVTPKVHY